MRKLPLCVVLSLAYPLPNYLSKFRLEDRPSTKRYGSKEALLRNTFLRCVNACGIGAAKYIIATALFYWLRDECEVIHEVIEDLIELCRDRIRSLTGNNRIRDDDDSQVGCPNFPSELLGEIGKRFESRLDILRFRSVCRGWRSSLPRPTRFPLLVPPPPNCYPESRNTPYFITEITLYRCKGGHFGVLFEEVNREGKFRGRYMRPYSKKCDSPITSFVDPKHRRSKISFLTKGYRIRMGQDLQPTKFVRIRKIAIISPRCHVNPSYVRASDLSVVAHLKFEGMEGRLALLRLGGSPENWHWDTDFCTQPFKAMCAYKGQLCVLDQWGRVLTMDYHSLQMTQLGPPLPFDPQPVFYTPSDGIYEKRLFECGGQLHAMDTERFQFTVPNVEIYRLSLHHDKWTKIDITRGGNRDLHLHDL